MTKKGINKEVSKAPREESSPGRFREAVERISSRCKRKRGTAPTEIPSGMNLAPEEGKKYWVRLSARIAGAIAIFTISLVMLIIAIKDVPYEGTSLWLTVVIVAYIFLVAQLSYWIIQGRWQWSFTILLVTMVAFVAFGLEIERRPWLTPSYKLELDVGDLATILVLFLLSELAVGLFIESRTISQDLSSTNKALNQTSIALDTTFKSIQKELSAKEFKDTVDILKKASQVVIAVDKLPYPVGYTLRKKMAKLGVKWCESLKNFGVGDGDKILDRFWESFIERYFTGETKAAANAKIVMDESSYLAILEHVVTAVTEISSTEKRIIFRGITVLLPEYWYMWPFEDGTPRRVLDAMENYRKIVEQIVGDKQNKSYQYERIVIATEQEVHNRLYRIPLIQDIQHQEDMALLYFLRAGDDPKGPQRYETLDHHKYNAMTKRLDLAVDELHQGRAFLIVDKDKLEAKGLPFPKKNEEWIERELPGGIGPNRVVIENLVHRYATDLHTKPNLATYVNLQNYDLQAYVKKWGSNFDMWLLGIETENGETEWKIVVDTTMRPGYGTLKLRVHCGAAAAEMGKWWSGVAKPKYCGFKWI